MRAGPLRKRVAIEQATETQDSQNEPIVTWTVYKYRWASIEPVRGNERYLSQEKLASVTHKIRIRYTEGVTPKMRINWAGRLFEIESIVDPFERHRDMQLMCTEYVDT